MLNFNVDPYYDDFDPNNHYHRILFRPGRAVQARELTQSQTILQDQISKFADHVFKQNTPVKGGQVTVNTKARYLKLNATYSDNDIVASDFLNQVITDADSLIFAKVIATEEGVGTDSPTLVVTYLSGTEFAAGAVIYSTNNSTVAQIVPADHTGYATTASVSEGVFYIVNGYSYSDVQNTDGTYSRYSIGNFVSLQPQTIIVQKYGNTPTKRIGLTISEYISDYVTDPALVDPAVGATNYQAPGADRYTIDLTLDTKPIELGSDSNFIELVRITNGNIQRLVDGTVYGVIDDYFAKRTFDTNGDFVVNDFKLVPKANTANPDNYKLQVGTGVAYIRGYRVENALDKTLETTRARTTEFVNNSQTSVDYGNYIYINNANNLFDTTQVIAVDFHCINTNSAIVTTNTTTYNSTKVASGYLRALTYDSNTLDSNTMTYIYKAQISDLQNYVLSGTASSGTSNSIIFTDTTGKFSGSVANAYYNATITIDSGPAAGDARRIVSYNQSTKTATVDKNFTIAPTSASTFSLRFGVKDIDLMVVPTASGYNKSASAGIDPKGKSDGLSNGDTNIYDASSPELIFNLGYDYISNLADTSYSSFKVFRGITFNSGVGTFNLSGVDATFFGTSNATQTSTEAKLYWQVVVTDPQSSGLLPGAILDFTPGSATQKIALDSTRKLATLTYGSSTFTGTIITKVAISNAGTTSLTLKRKDLYLANTTQVFLAGTDVSGTKVDLTNGQVYIPHTNVVSSGKQSLYISDAKRIVKIIDTGGAGVIPTNSMLTNTAYNVTGNFIFDNGQTDSYYGPASITLRPGAPRPVGDLLVLVDYYSHGGGDGYFSVNSYRSATDGGVSTKPENYAEIPSYTSKAGTVYQLRDAIDFRLSTKNAQAAFEFRFSTTPTSTNSAGAYLPIDLSTFTTDYTHYLGRKDILVLSKDKSFSIVQGKPSNNPSLPTTPEGSLLMANIILDPYTAYLPDEVPSRKAASFSLERIQHKRWAMSDISDLQTRVNNIEYYTSLSLLEKQASDLQVPDNNGLNRFKNGILVDNFTSFATADSGNADFSAKIDKRQTFLTATDTVMNFPLQAKDVLNSLGQLSDAAQTTLGYKYHTASGGASSIITLPYTSANLIAQKIASNTISLNPFAVAVDEGVLDINPPMDMWVSTSKDPDILITDPNLTIQRQGTSLNQLSATGWETISGTQYTTTTQAGSIVTVSSYGSQTQQTLSGYYDKVNALNSTYITDISVQPYIRAQKLIVRAKGMKVNTPVSVFFDGTNVNQYIIQPNIIELSGVNGTFSDGDVVGYYSAGTFFPTGRVVGSTNLGGNKVRLRVTSDNATTTYSTNSVLQNAKYSETGIYAGNTAFGTFSSAATGFVSLSGKISSVGGSPTTTAMNGGGTYYSGVTSVVLGSTASATNDFYTGSTLTVKTFNQYKTTQAVVVGQQWEGDENSSWLADVVENRDFYANKEETYVATITAYNGTTKVATLSGSTPINVSIGTNSLSKSSTKTAVDSTYSISGSSYLVAQATSGKVPTMSTDEYGNFSAIFSIPANTFKTGDRILRVDNRTVDTDPDSATTYSQGVFTASSIATKSQTLNLGATVQAAAKSTVFASQAQKNDVLLSRYSYNTDPVAQTFIIDKETYPNGAFIKSIKVFFKSKPTGTSSVPVKLFVTDTTNGYPNGAVLDNSLVVKNAQDVNVSSNPQYLNSGTYTEFVFPAPVYIRPNNLFAFVLQTTSPDYTIWIAAQNAIAVASSTKNLPSDTDPTTVTKIGGSPYVGALFESQNGITWTADQTKNLMFIIDNCVFPVSTTPTVQFVVPKKLPMRKLVTTDIEYFKDANTISNIDGTFYARDLRSDAYNLTSTDFAPTSTSISYTYTPTLQSTYTTDVTRDVTPGKYGTSMPKHIYLDDGSLPRVLDSNSATSFTMTTTMTTTDPFVTPVLSDDGMSLYNIKFNINDMGIGNSDITMTSDVSTVNVTAPLYTSAPAVTISAPTGTNGSQAYATANIVSVGSGNYIVDKINVTASGSGYISTPTLTIASNGTVSATATVSGETSAKGGNGLARYITKKVVLTPANDSSDLRVYYTAYKPLNSRISVYYKVLSRNDTSNLNNQNWVLMTEVGERTNTYSLNRDDVKEYVSAPGALGVASNQITYTSSSGVTYTDFGQFAIKVVLSTADTTKVPVIHDLRVLALPSGSGY